MLCKKKKSSRAVSASRLKSCTLTIRRSGMLRSYKIGSRPFDTFARCVFLRLARSCRVVEKFDKNHRFFVIFCRSGPEKRSIGSDFSATRQDLGKRRTTHLANVLNFMLPRLQRLGPSERRAVPVQRSDFTEKQHNLALGSRSDRISPQRGTISENGEKPFRAMYRTSCLRGYSVWVHRSVEFCCHNDRILLKNSIIWLSGADRIEFLRNATRSRQTEKNCLSKCIELHACEFIASGSIGASSCACATIGFH